ncbi:hypothetical protein HFN16_06965 [Pseudodesulfovibrio sp. zrk46]|nr:hypothetical protein HFN16_06965 [Pseudodesulfovibrio sp. zrk46]
MYRILATALALLCLATSAHAMSFNKAIKQADPTAKYLFYLHGAIVEEMGKAASSKRYGVYNYDRIIEHFEDRGLTVIDEVRGKVNPNKYAAKITKQVRMLMTAGVPARNITVSGFSKGGYITLLVASSLNNPEVGYVIMAGCGRGKDARPFELFLKNKRGARLKGRIFSIYASSDMEAGSCRPAIEQADARAIEFRETRIKSQKGHGLFYQPRPDWIEPTAIFAKGGR